MERDGHVAFAQQVVLGITFLNLDKELAGIQVRGGHTPHTTHAAERTSTRVCSSLTSLIHHTRC